MQPRAMILHVLCVSDNKTAFVKPSRLTFDRRPSKDFENHYHYNSFYQRRSPLQNRKKPESETICLDYDDSIKELYTNSFASLVLYLKTQFRSCPHQAEEIAQHAFEKIAAQKNPGAIGNIRAFLWRTAHNLAISNIRSKKMAAKYMAETRQMYSNGKESALTPERVLEAREQVEITQKTLRRMPAQRRRAFILTRVKGLSQTEAAKRLGISRPAVSKHVAKAVAELYKALHGENTLMGEPNSGTEG